MHISSVLKSLSEVTLTSRKGRTAAVGTLAIGTCTTIGGVLGFWKAVGETGFALTAPVSYPLMGFGIGKVLEKSFEYSAFANPEDMEMQELAKVPFSKTLAASHALLIPLAPLKAATAWTSIPKGITTGFAAGCSGTLAFYVAERMNPEAAQANGEAAHEFISQGIDQLAQDFKEEVLQAA